MCNVAIVGCRAIAKLIVTSDLRFNLMNTCKPNGPRFTEILVGKALAEHPHTIFRAQLLYLEHDGCREVVMVDRMSMSKTDVKDGESNFWGYGMAWNCDHVEVPSVRCRRPLER